jgi:fructose/tagatose bisphosphate aldolase
MTRLLPEEILASVGHSITFQYGQINILNKETFRARVESLARIAALGDAECSGWARYVLRETARQLGIYPASLERVYRAMAVQPDFPRFTVPAINLRVLPYHSACAVFRAAREQEAAAIIFELSRTEMEYTGQEPAEYAAMIFAAAISCGYQGPLFLQGDHFEINESQLRQNPCDEIGTLETLVDLCVAAGFYQFDLDASTSLPQDGTRTEIPLDENIHLSSQMLYYIRSLESEGLTMAVGASAGAQEGANTTQEDLRAFLNGFNAEMSVIDPDCTGFCKVSIHSDAKHGGVVLPDGSIARVRLDFDTIQKLGKMAREEFGLGGIVQHGASTLPEEAFGKFVEVGTCEIHLATNMMNIFFNLIPASLRQEMYQYAKLKCASERKPYLTDDQFYYNTRKNAIGPFKKQCWDLPAKQKEQIVSAWEEQFNQFFTLLQLKGTRDIISKWVQPVDMLPILDDYLPAD